VYARHQHDTGNAAATRHYYNYDSSLSHTAHSQYTIVIYLLGKEGDQVGVRGKNRQGIGGRHEEVAACM
jgi:hypothetical protein